MAEVYKLCLAYPSLIDVPIETEGQIVVVGDVHGQFFDLLHIFELRGWPSPLNLYLFNGDFVDRGSFSVEVALTLLGLKVLYPNSVHILRGNHEAEGLNTMYGFRGEVKAKYPFNNQVFVVYSIVFYEYCSFFPITLNELMFDAFQDVFCALPLAACINNGVFVRLRISHGLVVCLRTLI